MNLKYIKLCGYTLFSNKNRKGQKEETNEERKKKEGRKEGRKNGRKKGRKKWKAGLAQHPHRAGLRCQYPVL